MMSGPHEVLQSNQTPGQSQDHVVARCSLKSKLTLDTVISDVCFLLSSRISNVCAVTFLMGVRRRLSILYVFSSWSLAILSLYFTSSFLGPFTSCPIPGNLNRAVHTCMVAMHEYTDSYFKRRSLRFSFPTGMQRSTYWLQLPYRYGIPLLIASGLLHWIVSETLFLVRICFFDRDGNPITDCKWCTPSNNILILLGYSTTALMVAIVLEGVMVAILLATGMRRFKSGMPIVRSSSWSIAAACHHLLWWWCCCV